MSEAVVICGDALETLQVFDDNSIQCCVTSPPYWSLRDYKSDGQIGIEKSPDEYIFKLVRVFREVKRVLRMDGTLWLNIGDSYARQAGDDSKKARDTGFGKRGTGRTGKSKLLFKSGNNTPPPGLKAKDLVGIPWTLALALRTDGWYLRQDIIWSKPNAMPESVHDRCTRAHEYLFMLTKSAKYFYDDGAIMEPCVCTQPFRFTDGGKDKQRGHTRRHAGFNGRYAEKIARDGAPTQRNKRSVWEISTRPYKGAHFATFPSALVEPCILAGSRPGDTVIDPFAGSGTVGQVAVQHGRDALLIELNEDYCRLAEERVRSGR